MKQPLLLLIFALMLSGHAVAGSEPTSSEQAPAAVEESHGAVLSDEPSNVAPADPEGPVPGSEPTQGDSPVEGNEPTQGDSPVEGNEPAPGDSPLEGGEDLGQPNGPAETGDEPVSGDGPAETGEDLGKGDGPVETGDEPKSSDPTDHKE